MHFFTLICAVCTTFHAISSKKLGVNILTYLEIELYKTDLQVFNTAKLTEILFFFCI